MPEHDPTTSTYRHPTPEEIPHNTNGLQGDGATLDLARCVANNTRAVAELFGKVERLEAAVEAAREDGHKDGRQSILDGTADAARAIAENIRDAFTADNPPPPPELLAACRGPRRSPRDVDVDVRGTLVTVTVTPGVTDPYEVWENLLAERG